jgi:nitroreductase
MTPDQLRTAIAAAVRAPSVHNSQPWHFSLDAQGSLLVHADRRRQLVAQDPEGRELAISCGAAAAHARTALRATGVAARVVVRPDVYDADLLAKVVVTGTAVATEEDARRSAAIALRRTDRTPFSPEPVDDGLVDEVRAAAEEDGAWVKVLGADETVALAVLMTAADGMQRADEGVQADLVRFTHDTPGGPEGLVRSQHARPGSPVPLRDFGPGSGDRVVSLDPPVAEHPVLLVLGTAGDAPTDWVRAGVALSDLLLAATARGLVLSPMTQVLEVPVTRAELAREVGVLGRPQMVLRMGWPQGLGSPPTGRRAFRVVTA